jgi:redox-sensitive bicupin YhaK (pirin superfamily)
MIQIRKSNERGNANHGWLHSRHTFSFADYNDPDHMGFSVLRVINEDQIEPGTGFGTHGHQDMEIVSYVIDGALEHQDSMGNKTIIKPGEIQRMSAGTGVRHSEHNHSNEMKTHFLQIWIFPDKRGYAPSYGQMDFESKLLNSNFALLVSNRGRDESITINQDADIYLGRATSTSKITHTVQTGRSIWIQLIKGTLQVLGHMLNTGDGAAITDEQVISMDVEPGTEFLLFDMSAQ